jgi:ribosomal protein S18 acetylase RimI-like enzyme
VAGGGAALAGLATVSTLAAAAIRRARWRQDSRTLGFRYNRRYSERIRLRDGTVALIRMIMPWDKHRLQAGMRSLSPDSRYERFHVGKNRLSPAELRYFTEVDGIDHFALGAMQAIPWGAGLGIARFVRYPDRPATADAALVVSEFARRKGLGRELFHRLMGAARERGIRALICDVRATNRPMLRLLDSLAPGAQKERDGADVRITITL